MLKYLFGRRSSYLNTETIDKVQSLCRSIENEIDRNNLHREILQLFDRLLKSHSNKSPRSILQEHMNFSINKGLSQTHSQGVFLDYGQINKAGQLVAIYPGTIYRRHIDPLLLPSIRNRFLLARKDDLIIDGRDRGLSRSIYLSCHARYPSYDKTWLSQDVFLHKNPLTLGHYINHFPSDGLPNVTYHEFDFNFNDNEYDLYRFVPNVRYTDTDMGDDDKGIPSVVLISLRQIKQGEELFSCYLNIIQEKEKS
ncbi:unnamed protein product [Rotaria magnacalcarata]|uniref:SET domain-containing protein n=1 Tax=Rotaria magnacalcarata TaxID=392030 RepID=A0A815GKN5_9BILA|nr:unnamed protein product [Rotaria magnacalcarata]CAF1437719.1 unnamed protein product [Rotaria magnacalcarata]CAF2023175.1 unnamed protein product [Rotaria magnacalcarata]CAF2189552.1 unnamed protein product [Rotaria magnacalcarata]CAF2190179.1 unnamed protein product [Rotaria magnacalcarata]